MKRPILFLVLSGLMTLGLFIIPLNAQISEGGIPPSFQQFHKMAKSAKTPYAVAVDFDVEKLRAEDAALKATGIPAPLRAATIIPVEISMKKNGEWFSLPNGETICQMTIEAPGAIATMFYYDEFYIPEGGKLFIYNKEKTQVIGAYTSLTNPEGKEFATELVAGDVMVLEYVAPRKSRIQQSGIFITEKNNTLSTDEADQARIKISGIGYGYNHIAMYPVSGQNNLQSTGFGTSLPCQVNVGCSEGEYWVYQAKGTVRLYVRTGTTAAWCTGTIMNNTNLDNAPLLLSASHCFQNSTEANLNQTIAYFHYEHPGCGSGTVEPVQKTMTGMKMLVNIPAAGGSDGSLLRFNQSIPDEYDTYYNGWNRESLAATSGVSIHHPAGDVKKIATYDVSPVSGTWIGAGFTGATNAHWRLRFKQTPNGFSVTEGGSSGSALFNQQGVVVGTLTGGPVVNCATASANQSFYGKLWYHWDQYGTNPGQQMKTYLDPINSGVTTLGGKTPQGDLYVADFTADRTTVWASESIKFTDMSLGASTYYWTFQNGTPAATAAKNPTVQFNSLGTQQVRLVINRGTANEREKIITVQVNDKKQACDQEVSIGTATGKSQFPLGLAVQQVISSSIYTTAELNGAGLIKSIQWEAENSVASPRSFYIYLKETDESEHLTPATYANEIADATLVYKSPEYGWVNDAGIAIINLATPFRYSGIKNLKVITRSVSSAVGRSAEVAYSNITNAHQQWTENSLTEPSGNGAINNNRPDIAFLKETECGKSVVLADFRAGDGKETLFDADFDSPNFPPQDWNVKNKGTSANTWIEANYNDAFNFSHVDTLNTFSAFVRADNTNRVDAWLESPVETSLPVNASIEFYSFYEGAKLNNAQGSLHITDDSGTTWTEIWTTGSVADPNLGFKWRKENIDLSAYAGSNVQLAWRCEGQGGSDFGIDGLRLYVPSGGTARVFEGEYLQFTDVSQGPPVLWGWTFTGGNPGTSIEQNPRVYYGQQIGLETVLPVRLDIRNNTMYPAQNYKINPTAVKVVKRKPVSGFTSEGGNYTLYGSYGQLLPPTGGTVDFSDVSGRFPTSWEWKTAATNYATQNARHKYTAKGSYDVSLKAVNLAGNDTRTETGYVQVGGKADIWNMPYADPGLSLYSDVLLTDPFYLTGSNPDTDSYAEKFKAPASGGGSITEVKIGFKKGTNNDQPYTIGIYAGSGGIPAQNPLATLELAATDVQADGYTTVTFPEPVYVSGEFFITVSGFTYNPSGAGNSAIYTSEKQADGECTAYGLNSSNTWYRVNEMHENANLSLNIVPAFEYSELVVTPEVVFLPATPSSNNTITVTSNVTWKATTEAGWITLTTASGSGNGQIVLNVTENFSFERSNIITVTGGGITRKIIVKQDQPASPQLLPPGTLIATVTGIEENDVQLTWTDMTLQSIVAKKSPDASPVNSPVKINGDLAALVEHVPSLKAMPLQNELMSISATEKVLRWDNGIVNNSVRLTSGIPVEMCIRWDAVDLHTLDGTTLKEIIIYNAVPGAQHEMCIYQNGIQLYIQALTGLVEGYNRVKLVAPHTIDASKELIVSYKVSNYGADYPAAYDSGPAIDNKGNLIYYAGEFAPLVAGNWNMGIVIENNNAISYTVYRDGMKIADNITEPAYTDRGLTRSSNDNGYCYHVKSYYHKVNEESAPSNQQCINIKHLISAKADNVTRFAGEVNPAFIVSYTGLIAGYDAGTIDTPPTAVCDADVSYPAGTYPITLSGGSDDIYRFAYLPGTLTIADTPAPADLAATLENHVNVKLTWTAITGITGLTYKIFRDGIKIVDNLAATVGTYTDTNVESGAHYYTIVAAYKAGVESEPSVPAYIFVDRAPTGLTAMVQNNVDVQLNWTSAGNNLNIRYNIYRDGVKIAEVSETGYIDPALTEGSHSYKVSALHAGVETELSVESTVFIKHLITIEGLSYIRYEGEANPVFSATASGNFIGGNTESDILALLTIACAANTTSPAGIYPITITAPVHASYRFDNITEGALTVLSRASLDNFTAVVVNDTDVELNWVSAGSDLTIRYNIYRDGVMLAQVSGTSYTDQTAIPGEHSYEITIVYNSIGESAKSAPKTIFIKHLITVTGIDYIRYEGEVNPVLSATATGNFIGGDTEADILALLTIECTANTTSPAGIYPVTITAPVHGNYRFDITEGKLSVLSRASLDNFTAVVVNNTDVQLNWTDAGSDLTIRYNIYRDGVMLTQASETAYKDQAVTAGAHTYEITIVYPGISESPKSAPQNIFVKHLIRLEGADYTRYEKQLNPATYVVTATGDFVDGDTEADILPLLTTSCVATETSPAGTYPIVITTPVHAKYRFGIMNGTLTVLTDPVIGVVTGLSAEAVNKTDIRLEWPAVNGATGYNIYRDNIMIESVYGTTYTDKELIPAQYCYDVRTVNIAGTESGPSDKQCITLTYELALTMDNCRYDAANDRYIIDCGYNTTTVTVIHPDPGIKIYYNGVEGNNFTVNLPAGGEHLIDFTMTDSQGGSYNYSLAIVKPFTFDSVVQKRWDNTLTVINNPANNGGYTFNSYKWYYNGKQVGTGQSYSAGSDGSILPEGDYHVELSAIEFTGSISTCSETVIRPAASNKLMAYPNPVQRGKTITVESGLIKESGAIVELFNLKGVKVSSTPVNDENVKIKAPTQEGAYIMSIRAAGQTETFNLIVE